VKLIRVFPRRTKATPTDDMTRVGPPDLFDEADAVHISVTFSWDIPTAERLSAQWSRVAPTTLAGPAYGTRGEEFEPGRYLAPGYTITSRGCPRRCWFCSVWKRDGDVRELAIRDGWNILDDNILATSRDHFAAVCAMLQRQDRRAEFTGGLDYRLLTDWHVSQLATIRPRPACWFAYDPGDDFDGIFDSGRRMLVAGWTRESHRLRCYVLVGYPRDTMTAADTRLRQALACGFTPMAMLYRDDRGQVSDDWRAFQRRWARPAIIHGKATT
jgi:hypothetical protein